MIKNARILLILSLFLTISACDLFKKKGADPLPGKRISIIVDSADTEVDKSADIEPIKIPAPYINDFWLQPGALATHTPQHLDLAKNFKEFIRYSIGEGSSDDKKLRIQPIYLDNVIYSVDADYVVKAHDIKTNKSLWTRKLTNNDKEGNQFGGGLSFNAGKLYIATGFAKLFVINIDNGEISLTIDLQAPSRAAPSVLGDLIYTTTIDNTISAWKIEDGKKIWSYKSANESAGILGSGNPAIAQGAIFTGFSSGEVVALRANNGQIRWNDNLSGGIQAESSASIAEISAPIVVDGNNAYVIANSNRFVAFNIRTGARIWTKKIGSIQMPWLAGNYIYILTNNAKLLVLNTEDGKPLWVYQLPIWNDIKEKREPFVWTGPVLAGGQLIITNQYGLIKVFNPNNGELINDIKLDKPIYIAPIIAQSQLFILSDDGTLIGYK